MLKRFLYMVCALFIAALVVVTEGRGKAEPMPDSFDEDVRDDLVLNEADILRVIDGDTLVADLGDEGEATIRLLGVNTPETVDPRKAAECFGKEASNFTKHELEGKRVILEADPLADESDRYGRLLRVVKLLDGTDFNAKLIEQGYAYALIAFPLSPERKHEYKMLEGEAELAERGLWNPDTCGDAS